MRLATTAMGLLVLAAGLSARAGEAEKPAATTHVDVVLLSFGDKKISVIKEVRTITGLGLKQTKDLVELAPVTVKPQVLRAEAEKLRDQLQAAGATVELRPVGARASPTLQPAPADAGTVDVVLLAGGDRKISVIKEIRAMTGLGLKDAKDLVEAAPKTVKAKVARAEAEKMREQLQAAGATVELR